MGLLERRGASLTFFVGAACVTYMLFCRNIHIIGFSHRTAVSDLHSRGVGTESSTDACLGCDNAADITNKLANIPSTTTTFGALEWSGLPGDECLSVRSDEIFQYVRLRGAISPPHSAHFVFMLTDTLMDVSYPGKTCHAEGNYVKTTSRCIKCDIDPWYAHATPLMEKQMKKTVQKGDSAPIFALDSTWPACQKYFVTFATAYKHPIDIRQGFSQEDPCVVRLLQDAEHGVYRPGLDISFPTQPYPSVLGLRNKFIDESNPESLHTQRLHLLGFQGRGWRRKNLTPFLLKMQWYRDEIAQNLRNLHRADIFVNVGMNPPPENYMKSMNSTFALVLRGDKTYSFRLFEVMVAGAIPVIISVPYVLPFAEILPWHTFSVLWPVGKIHELPGHLDTIVRNPKRLRKMQQNLQQAWYNHFQNPEVQIETVKSILRWRKETAVKGVGGQWDGGFHS